MAGFLPVPHRVRQVLARLRERHRAGHRGGLPEHAQQDEDKNDDATHGARSLNGPCAVARIAAQWVRHSLAACTSGAMAEGGNGDTLLALISHST